MFQLSETERRSLLKFARSVISVELAQEGEEVKPFEVSDAMRTPCGCFVTLHKAGSLRGCIGNIEATRSLLDGIKENALNAAFQDPRFSPLEVSELPTVNIEISVLSLPQELQYKSADDLLEKLKPGIHGVIIAKNWNSATFLPQVWQQLPQKRSFLEHLCQKAGLKKNCWQNGGLSVKVYTVEHFSE